MTFALKRTADGPDVIPKMDSRSGTPLVTLGMTTGVSGGPAEQRWMELLVDDLRRQTLRDWELIVNVNGGTDDRVEEIGRALQGLPLRAIFRQRVPQPAPHNQRHIFQMSRGRYFAWVADHDRYPATCFEKLAAVLESEPGTAIAYGRTQLIGPEDEVLSVYDDALDTRGLSPADRGIKLVQTLRSCNQYYGLWRAETLEKMDLFLHARGTDHLWLLQAALLGDIVQLPEILFMRRKNRELPLAAAEARIVDVSFHPGQEILRRAPWCHLVWGHLAQVGRLLVVEDRHRAQMAILEHCFAQFRQALAQEIKSFGQFESEVEDGRRELPIQLMPEYYQTRAMVTFLARAAGVDKHR